MSRLERATEALHNQLATACTNDGVLLFETYSLAQRREFFQSHITPDSIPEEEVIRFYIGRAMAKLAPGRMGFASTLRDAVDALLESMAARQAEVAQ